MSQPYPLRAIAATALAVLLAGCAATPAPEEPPAEPDVEVSAAPEPEPVYRPIPTDTLYELLVAELAARRGAVDLALGNYLRQARETRDPGVAAQAARIARYLNAGPEALEAALLWAEVDPANPEARFGAASELARAGRAAEAFEQMRALHEIDGHSNFTAVAAAALDSPEQVRRTMIEGLARLTPDTPDILVARALLLQSVGDNDAALELTERVLAIEPDNQQAVLIEAQVWQNRGDNPRAYARIGKVLAAEPDNSRLRLHYARLLARSDIEKSEEQFRILVEGDPENGELRLSLALVCREAKHYECTREHLGTLLEQGNQPSAAHFYLGEDDERNKDIDSALEHYRAVQPSSLYAAALTRLGEIAHERGGAPALQAEMGEARGRNPEQAVRILLLESELLANSGELERAWSLLSTALVATPSDSDLLYARSMVAEKRRDIPALEADLREMLRQKPDSALALNALGYSLANLTDRHTEALELIRRALELQPDDPAILDSMGWVQYRLGQPEMALDYLQKAFDRFPDHEVAAHLGEVLWVMGRTKEARGAWDKGLESKPDSPIIHDAMQRLGALPASPSN